MLHLVPITIRTRLGKHRLTFFRCLGIALLSLISVPISAATDQKEASQIELNSADTNTSEQAPSSESDRTNATSQTSLIEPLEDDDTAKQLKENGCRKIATSEIWVDRLRAGTHTRLCNTASWVDGLFGEEHQFDGRNFRGKISVGYKHDEIEGFDPRLRVRIRTKLPNVSSRLNAFIGRVEEDSYISNTEVNEDRLNNVGLRSTNDEDSEWLVGLGYRTPTKDNNGWDFSVGAKISSGFSPYAKMTHRYLFETSDDSFWKTNQTVFWRENEGFGVSSNADYTLLLTDDDITVLHGSVKYTEEAEQWEWFTDATWHHSLSDKRGISSSVYMRGEEESVVSIPEFGMTLTYIRPVLRDWLYMEAGVDLRWEKDFGDTAYKSAIRYGLQFEMLLGDYYRRRRHK